MKIVLRLSKLYIGRRKTDTKLNWGIFFARDYRYNFSRAYEFSIWWFRFTPEAIEKKAWNKMELDKSDYKGYFYSKTFFKK